MREYFEASSSALIEVDPYRRSSRSTSRNDNVSIVYFKASRGSSRVELQWHLADDFHKLSKDQKYEIMDWMRMD